MTLREALQAANLDKIYHFINKQEQRDVIERKMVSLEKTIRLYSHVVEELLSKPKVKAYRLTWFVQESFDPFDREKYIDVCFLNPNYVAPKKGLKPWGGGRGKKIPKGHYNCNAARHNRLFSAGSEPWSEIIDTPIVNNTKYTLEEILACILWELTFHGFTENKVKENVKRFCNSIKLAEKEIKEGKYVEWPSSKKGSSKVVIPDSVSKQIIDIANKKTRL
jgi:hypothetical protein